MKLFSLLALLAFALSARAAQAAPGPPASPWNQPAAALAEQIADLLGPAQAHLTIRNLSNIPTDEIPAIRRLLEADLKSHGVQASGAESANTIRVTLSENLRERLWVAEVIEGSETRVAMVHVDYYAAPASNAMELIVLRKERLPAFINPLPGTIPDSPILTISEVNTGLVVLLPDEIALFAFGEGGYRVRKSLMIGQKQPLPRDPHGVILRSVDKTSFTAYTAGAECTGRLAATDDPAKDPFDGWTLHCHASDDPWPIPNPGSTDSTQLKAFYNAARNFFTGVVTPSLGVDLPPFYSAALIPRPSANAALVIGGIDGKVQLVEAGMLKQIAGARDWGSDFATLHSGCGSGAQIVASGSGEALTDSLRAYELPAQEAIPASAPLAMDGTVTALWPAPDDKSLFAVVRKSVPPTATEEYEVDRVTATCN
jgi:hypothetical protein